MLLHKKSETGRLSHSYEDTDTQGITTHYASRHSSKPTHLSTIDCENELILSSSTNNSKNIRFQLFPRTSDAVEQSISSVDQPTGVIEESATVSSKRSLAKVDSSQTINASRRQSLLRSPSSRYAIPKFPAVGKQSISMARVSMQPLEQGFLSPPISPQFSSHLTKKRTIRGALGAIVPDLYFTGTACTTNNDGNRSSGMVVNNTSGVIERITDELPIVEENLYKLHIRILYDEHRNDLIVNIIEGNYTKRKQENGAILHFL